MKTALTAYVVGVAVLFLAACSQTPDAPPTTAPSATPPTSTAPTFSPCDHLSARLVGRALGVEVTEETGDVDNPRCAYLPVVEGGPTLNVNYVRFKGSFDEAWASMGDLPGDVSDLEIDSANNARLVVNETQEAVVITGFVQTGSLIESVNAIQLAPFDRATMVRAATTVLTTLSARASSR